MSIATVTDIPSDNDYAYALSKTLTRVCSPVTVGLYSECHNRINTLLRNIEGHMVHGKKDQTDKARYKPSISGQLALIFRLVFYRPVWTEENQHRKDTRFLFVRFSAWHFAGSDMLWAGLVMHLCKSFQKSFGKFHLGLFRTVQYDEEEDGEKKNIEEKKKKDWRFNKLGGMPIWAILLVGFTGTLLILIPLIIHGFPDVPQNKDEPESEGYGVLEGFAIAVLGVPAAGILKFLYLFLKNVICDLDYNVRQWLDNNKVSGQLGLMHEVRMEMRLLCCFIYFMEVFERRKIKVVLEITNLDRCTPKKIVGVLEAINILLSDAESPFISLLAVDPEVLVKQVQQAEDCVSKRDSAYGFLDRIITLPFTVPPLCDKSKSKVFRNIVSRQSDIPDHIILQRSGTSVSDVDYDCLSSSEEENSVTDNRNDEFRLFIKKESSSETFDLPELNLNEADVSTICILNDSKHHLQQYIPGDTMSMRRVINSIRVTISIMKIRKMKLLSNEKIAAWVVLVDRWPCRLSWILQCIEDDQQSAGAIDESQTLWQVFNKYSLELYMISHMVEIFLERDGDPELFENFLAKDFVFTVAELNLLTFYTVNLNSSIKKELSRIRGSSRLKRAGRNAFGSLSSQQVMKMKSEDIRQELLKIGLPEKYTKKVMEDGLDGRTILFSDPKDLKDVLQMTLGEWMTFKIHFLGVIPAARPKQGKSPPKVSKPVHCFSMPDQ